MKKYIPIRMGLEMSSYDKYTDIPMISQSILKILKSVSVQQNVPIEKLTFERKVVWMDEIMQWVDLATVSWEDGDNKLLR